MVRFLLDVSFIIRIWDFLGLPAENEENELLKHVAHIVLVRDQEAFGMTRNIPVNCSYTSR